LVKKQHHVAACLLVVAAFISGCSTQPELEPAPGATQSADEDLLIREPNDPILGNVSSDGKCDPQVVDIDHQKPVAFITYQGQPGDRIEVKIGKESGSEEPETISFEMDSHQTEMQLPTSIPNSSISEISVTAEGRVGKPGECVIEVA
jgi:hypothetical protein